MGLAEFHFRIHYVSAQVARAIKWMSEKSEMNLVINSRYCSPISKFIADTVVEQTIIGGFTAAFASPGTSGKSFYSWMLKQAVQA
jgi:hypothetical protein